MPTPNPDSPDDAEFDDLNLDDVELSDEWVNEARRREESADSRVERYSRIQAAHQTARAPRSWTPSESGGNSTGPDTWVKVTAIVLIVIAAAAVLSMLRAWG